MAKGLAINIIPQSIRQSLRYRLLAFLLLSLLGLMSITMIIGQRTANHEFEEILDGQLIATGRAVFSIIVLELRAGNASTIPVLLDEFVRHRQGIGDWIGENNDIEVYDNEFYFQLDDASGTTVFASREPTLVQQNEFPQSELKSTSLKTGLFKTGTGDDQWHLFSLRDAQTNYTFYTGQSQKLRYELSHESVKYILLPFILATVFILWAIWAGTRYGLKPLIQLTQELDSRTPAMLDVIEIDDKATELRPFIAALNKLLTRVRSSLEKERQFNADISHELRTPLAGITANLDAARLLSTLPEQEQFLGNIQSCVDNTTKVTEGLLLLSRLQSADLSTYFDSSSFDINDLVRIEIDKRDALTATGESRIRRHSISQNKVIAFRGSESLVEIAIGNILDNALKYSTGDVEVDIQAREPENIVISVSDYGPGIPNEQHDLIFQRFYRVNTNTTTGFGLGLALVQQIMIALGGTIKLANRTPKGLNATLTFPTLKGSG